MPQDKLELTLHAFTRNAVIKDDFQRPVKALSTPLGWVLLAQGENQADYLRSGNPCIVPKDFCQGIPQLNSRLFIHGTLYNDPRFKDGSTAILDASTLVLDGDEEFTVDKVEPSPDGFSVRGRIRVPNPIGHVQP